MKMRLESVDPFLPRLKWEMDDFPTVIGTSEEADIRLPDRGVSAWHYELFEQNGELAIRDIAGDEGVLVNGVSVPNAQLQVDDTLTLGIRFLRIVEISDSPTVGLTEAIA
jgi:pSer/pThr/pTyr-binding forkhead associated (FHA) protein